MAIQRLIIPVQSAKLVGSTEYGPSFITNPAGIDGGQNTWALLFDPSTQETATWGFQVPGNYTGSPSGNIIYSAASSVGSINIDIDMKASTGGNLNSTTIAFGAAARFVSTVPGSTGDFKEVTQALTTGDLKADAYAVIRANRIVGSSDDTATGALAMRALTFEYST